MQEQDLSQYAMKLPLFDDFWIDFRVNTVRRWFAPELHAVVQAGPYSSLVYDPERKVYRLYYEEKLFPDKDGPRALKLKESYDLVNFTQVLGPDGTDVLYDGETGIHGGSVVYDAFDPDPARRYKLCTMTRMERKGLPKEVEVIFSADGIRWETDHTHILHPYTSDTRNALVYNPLRREYMLLHRSAHVDRRISVKTSKDLKNWTESRIVLQPGANYNDGFTAMHHYAMGVSYMDGIFYGLLWRYNTNLYSEDYTRMTGFMEPELVYSYDGNEFLYTSGKPLMERPLPPTPGFAGLAAQDMCVSADGSEYYMVCIGYTHSHGTQDYNYRVSQLQAGKIKRGHPIYKIRRDGFCGIESVGPGGRVITKPLELMADDLRFNVRANGGWVRFGLMEKNGTFLDGFSFDDCVPYEMDDGLDVRPQWKEHTLSEVLNRQVRIAVELNGAILHCISATARPCMRQRQESFSRPMGVEY